MNGSTFLLFLLCVYLHSCFRTFSCQTAALRYCHHHLHQHVNCFPDKVDVFLRKKPTVVAELVVTVAHVAAKWTYKNNEEEEEKEEDNDDDDVSV